MVRYKTSNIEYYDIQYAAERTRYLAGRLSTAYKFDDFLRFYGTGTDSCRFFYFL